MIGFLLLLITVVSCADQLYHFNTYKLYGSFKFNIKQENRTIFVKAFEQSNLPFGKNEWDWVSIFTASCRFETLKDAFTLASRVANAELTFNEAEDAWRDIYTDKPLDDIVNKNC